jgi:Putative metal-binding motif
LSRGLCEGAIWLCGGSEGWACDYGPEYEPEEDRCDALDNDCDGETDEGFPTGGLCVVELGACSSSGVWVCAANASEIECAAPPIGLDEELCGDDVDNNCDGEIDEGYPIGDACEVGLGACRVTGRLVCASDDRSVVCDATPMLPGDEWCADGMDNDCDGETDETACSTEPVSPNDNHTVLDSDGVRGCALGTFGAADPTSGARLPLVLVLFSLLFVLSRRTAPRP